MKQKQPREMRVGREQFFVRRNPFQFEEIFNSPEPKRGRAVGWNDSYRPFLRLPPAELRARCNFAAGPYDGMRWQTSKFGENFVQCFTGLAMRWPCCQGSEFGRQRWREDWRGRR